MARTYEQAIAELRRALTFGTNPSLDAIGELCEALGRPQDAFRAVQVGGTNGKTSTARFVQALLHAEGLSTGLYTSPELERYPERIELATSVVSDDEFAAAVSAALDAAETLRPGAAGTRAGFTEFELTTAAALWLFRESGVAVAVLEVGMGGRWDATSVKEAEVSVVTGIGLDHVGVLGDTLEAIAAEKAEIIRPHGTAVLGPGTSGLERIFLDKADAAGARVLAIRERGVESPLPDNATVRYSLRTRPDRPGGATLVEVEGASAHYPGLGVTGPAYQAPNVACAVAAAEALLGRALDPQAAAGALSNARVPGRFELVSTAPPVVIDGSHNPQAAEVLAEAVTDAWPDPARRPVVLLGVLADKDARGIVAALAPVAAGFVVTQSSSDRALEPQRLADVVEEVTGTRPSVRLPLAEALRGSLGSSPDGLLVTGSITVAGEARTLLHDQADGQLTPTA